MANNLYQLNWVFSDGHAEMQSQINITERMDGLPVDGDLQNQAVAHEIYEWERDVFNRRSLPKDAHWVICNEESKHFVWVAEPVNV